MYAGVVQSDTFCAYINRRNDVFGDAKNITPENLYELSQYCYAYLKSCYITRDAAVGSLTEKTKKNNPTYASTQKMVNQEIAEYLIKLKMRIKQISMDAMDSCRKTMNSIWASMMIVL